MTKTNIKRGLAILALGAITLNSTFAYTQIGTGSITGGSNAAIMWDNNIPGTASGTVNGIVISAKVLPLLNMIVSTGGINLGYLSTSSYSSGSLDIEVGTNAANGVTVTAKSSNGGLTSTQAPTSVINALSADGAMDSYKFTSALAVSADSTISGYSRSSSLNTEIVDNTTNNTIYSTNKPESSSGTSDATLFVAARINEQTAAANDYTDTISITVTGNF